MTPSLFKIEGDTNAHEDFLSYLEAASTISYPAPKSLGDVIATALHEAKNETIRRKAKEARRIVKSVPEQLKYRTKVGDTFKLCSIDIDYDLTEEAYDALVYDGIIPRAIEDFLPTSTPYLVARTLKEAGQRVMINAFSFGESKVLGFKIAADDPNSIRLELRFISSKSNY